FLTVWTTRKGNTTVSPKGSAHCDRAHVTHVGDKIREVCTGSGSWFLKAFFCQSGFWKWDLSIEPSLGKTGHGGGMPATTVVIVANNSI
ncbi:MAG: hypothetical protein ACKPKO_36555, partial [Candidatus Fonsibacter sp.]